VSFHNKALHKGVSIPTIDPQWGDRKGTDTRTFTRTVPKKSTVLGKNRPTVSGLQSRNWV